MNRLESRLRAPSFPFVILRISTLIIGFLFIFSDVLFGQGMHRNVKVLITHVAVAEYDPRIEKILNRAALLKTEKLGFSGGYLETDADTFIPLPGAERKPFNESVSEIMHQTYKDADLIVIGYYRIAQEEIAIEYFCVESGFFSLVAFLRNTMPIDFSLDRSISSTIDTLFDSATEEIRRIAEAKSPDEVIAGETGSTPSITEELEGTADTASNRTALEASTSSSMMFFIGEAAGHFPMGLYARESILVPISSSRNSSVSAGLSAGYMRFFPSEPEKAKYIRSLVPVGLTTHAVVGWNSFVAWFIYVNAGGAYRLTAESVASEYLSEIIPYVELGGGMRVVPFGERVALNIHTSYLAIMNFYQESTTEEMSVDILSALCPGVSVRVRL